MPTIDCLRPHQNAPGDLPFINTAKPRFRPRQGNLTTTRLRTGNNRSSGALISDDLRPTSANNVICDRVVRCFIGSQRNSTARTSKISFESASHLSLPSISNEPNNVKSIKERINDKGHRQRGGNWKILNRGNHASQRRDRVRESFPIFLKMPDPRLWVPSPTSAIADGAFIGTSGTGRSPWAKGKIDIRRSCRMTGTEADKQSGQGPLRRLLRKTEALKKSGSLAHPLAASSTPPPVQGKPYASTEKHGSIMPKHGPLNAPWGRSGTEPLFNKGPAFT